MTERELNMCCDIADLRSAITRTNGAKAKTKVFRHTCRHACRPDMCIDMCPDMCIDMCADICVDKYADMCVGCGIVFLRSAIARTNATGKATPP